MPSGNNPEGARLTGIPVQKILLSRLHHRRLCCTASPRCCWSPAPESATRRPDQTDNLDTITAVVLGGTSLFGGRGLVIGTLIGALIVGVFRNGLQLMRIDSIYQTLVTGVLVILAVDRRSALPKEGTMTVTASHARAAGPRPGEAVRPRHGHRRRRLRTAARRGPGGRRRQRRRQVQLIKALTGAVQPDEGEICLDGAAGALPRPARGPRPGHRDRLPGPGHGRRPGHRHQHVPGPGTRRNRASSACLPACWTRRRCAPRPPSHMAELKIGLRSLTQPVETLSGGQRQGVAVARAAAWATQRRSSWTSPPPRSASRNPAQVLDLIAEVRDQGVPVVLISHNMPHVFEIADRIHIHRLGRRVALVKPNDFTMPEVVAIMTGALTVDAAGDTVVADSAAAKAAGVQAT